MFDARLVYWILYIKSGKLCHSMVFYKAKEMCTVPVGPVHKVNNLTKGIKQAQFGFIFILIFVSFHIIQIVILPYGLNESDADKKKHEKGTLHGSE